MARNPRVLAAYRAMRALGIAEATVKPVLKNLLRLYEKNWELIEEENYRALADAIFEYEETKVHFALLLLKSVWFVLFFNYFLFISFFFFFDVVDFIYQVDEQKKQSEIADVCHPFSFLHHLCVFEIAFPLFHL